ncbi:MAG: hypothetical protein QUV07_11895 [Cyanobium sp. CZS 25K]|nr:hypothetical protein [Cyanobium sp. CZS25K]
MGEAHRREVERTLQRHPEHSLGVVMNPALPKPEDLGSRPEEQRKDGSAKTWGASNSHIRGGIGAWSECDGGLSLEEQQQLPERAGLPRPSLAVWSGSKSLHMYWLLRDGEELLEPERFRSLQRRLAAAIEAAVPAAKPDKGIHNPYGEEEITLLEEEVLPAIQQCLQRVDAIDRVLLEEQDARVALAQLDEQREAERLLAEADELSV